MSLHHTSPPRPGTQTSVRWRESCAPTCTLGCSTALVLPTGSAALHGEVTTHKGMGGSTHPPVPLPTPPNHPAARPYTPYTPQPGTQTSVHWRGSCAGSQGLTSCQLPHCRGKGEGGNGGNSSSSCGGLCEQSRRLTAGVGWGVGCVCVGGGGQQRQQQWILCWRPGADILPAASLQIGGGATGAAAAAGAQHGVSICSNTLDNTQLLCRIGGAQPGASHGHSVQPICSSVHDARSMSQTYLGQLCCVG
jgi:hypothetical protein